MTWMKLRNGFLLLGLWMPLLVQAGEMRCMLSFDSARLDVCTGTAHLVNEGLAHLAEVAAFDDSGIRVIKFDGPIHRAQRDAVESLGAEILGYAPFHAYVVRMPPALDVAAGEIDGVIWAGPFLPVWKLEINLVNELQGARIVEQAGLTQLRVSLQPGVSVEAGRSMSFSVPGLEWAFTESGRDHERLVFAFDRDHLTTIIEYLARSESVAAVNLRWPYELMNSQAGWLHQSGATDVTPIFDQGIFGCGQVLGVLDSGLHVPHCSFNDPDFGEPAFTSCASGANCPPITPDFAHRKIGAHYKWSAPSGGPADDHGHGTHVIGSAVGNNRADAVDCETFTTPGGITDLDGTAPGAQVISQEAGANLQYLNSLSGTLYHAAEVAFQNGARIHNNSWGSGCRNVNGQCIAGCQVGYRETTRDADAVVWDYPELAVFVAAGNSGAGCAAGANVGSPGNAKSVFSIGSNQRGAAGDHLSAFSSRGPTPDRRTKPDLSAQGQGIVSAQRDACGTRMDSGTSMASPTAAGLAALVREYLQRGFYPSGIETTADAVTNPSGALIKAMMINGAAEMTGNGSGGATPNQNQGWGRVHLDNALYFEGDQTRLWLHDGVDGLETGDVQTYLLEVQAGHALKVNLVWHDYPALVNANPHIVNLLRLELETPAGEVWTQKLSTGGGLAVPDPFQDIGDADYDDRNTVHRIVLSDPAPGLYEVRVRAIQVAEGGTQPYALVATGEVEEASAFILHVEPAAQAVCAGEAVMHDIELRGLAGFDDPVTLTVDGLPVGAGADFSPNPVVPADPPAGSVLAIDVTHDVAGGDYDLDIFATSDGPGFDPFIREGVVHLTVFPDSPEMAESIAPADNATDVALQPVFTWTAAAQAAEYRIEVATDTAFEDLVIAQSVFGTIFIPAVPLDARSAFYWRVRAENACGAGPYGEIFHFTTEPLPGDCAFGTETEEIWGENFAEGDLPDGWSTAGSTGAATWVVTDQHAVEDGYSVFAENIDTTSEQILITPAITLPVGGEALLLYLQTWQEIQSWPQGGCFDGGLLEISANDGGDWSPIGNDSLVARPYDGNLSSSWGNPLAGRQAWCGDPRDFWERYAVDLLPWAGETARFRFRFGTDSQSSGHVGWFIDAVGIRTCETVPAFAVGGEVTGLEGGGLVLRNNGEDDLELAQNGPFEFSTPLSQGQDYAVTVAVQPGHPSQICTVESGSGTVNGQDIDDVLVDCRILSEPIFEDRFE